MLVGICFKNILMLNVGAKVFLQCSYMFTYLFSAYERCVSSVHEPDEPSSPMSGSISSHPVVNIPLDEEDTRLPASAPEVS